MIYEKQDLIGVFDKNKLYSVKPEPESSEAVRPKLIDFKSRKAFNIAVKEYYLDRESKRLKELKRKH